MESNQSEPHPRTAETALKHLKNPWKKPYAHHSLVAFEKFQKEVSGKKLWLDTGCGTGESTARLAVLHPELLIIGIDKSEIRLQAHKANLRAVFPRGLEADNYILLRADLEDIWRLCYFQGIRFVGQSFFYPNPWPKAEQRLRRWPHHPVFPYALACSPQGILRTNWLIYAQEWAVGLQALTGSVTTPQPWSPSTPQTAFERKYQTSGHPLWQLFYQIDSSWEGPLQP